MSTKSTGVYDKKSSYTFGIDKEKSKVMYVALTIVPFFKVALETSTKFKSPRKCATTGFYDTKKQKEKGFFCSRTACIRHPCTKTTVSSCHRCLIV
jgi:hypothetical protein